MTAADTYARQVRAVEAQRVRRAQSQSSDERWSAAAQRFRQDPRREPDANLLAIAAYLRPDDVLVDVGGGAGRYGLPLALRCREVINVEPAPGMGAEFEASAQEAGISNARWLQSGWLEAQGVAGDVTLVANVTYFVADIVAFIEKLIAATRRRVIIAVSSTPPPNQQADIFRALHGEELLLLPGYRELMPVLWEMGLLPELRVLGSGESMLAQRIYASQDEAIDATVRQMEPADQAAAMPALRAHFEELFSPVDGGFRRRSGSARQLLVTWDVTEA